MLTTISEHFISPKGFFYNPKRLERKAPLPHHPDSVTHSYHRRRRLLRLNLRLKSTVSIHWHQQQRAQPSSVPNTNIPIFKITDQPGYGGRCRDVCVLVRQLNRFPSYNKIYMQTKLQRFHSFSSLLGSRRSDKADQNQNFCLVTCRCILI